MVLKILSGIEKSSKGKARTPLNLSFVRKMKVGQCVEVTPNSWKELGYPAPVQSRSVTRRITDEMKSYNFSFESETVEKDRQGKPSTIRIWRR